MAIPYVIRRDPPSSVIYDLTQPNQVTVTLPTGSAWTSGLHWHETHTEYLRVVQGKVRVRLGNEIRTISAADGEVKVARNVWHEWSRDEAAEEEVIVIERTDPADGDKAIFFWNLNAVILNAQKVVKPALIPGWLFGLWMDFWVSLNLFVIFDGLDNFPVFLELSGLLSRWGRPVTEGTTIWHYAMILERLWTHFLVGLATRVGWVMGVRAVREKYTPPEAYRRWKSPGKLHAA
ncbi:hypothetical protein GQ53DRAFT_759265 [Thozetella sp. PMI_491]|nr:hypothetical protein GQ53DRAFT_759265 [Thozetella sp. PMI_491]